MFQHLHSGRGGQLWKKSWMSECTTLTHLPMAAITSPTAIWYMNHKMEKRHQHEQCIMEAKHSILIQLVFTDTKEILKQRWTFYNWLASLLRSYQKKTVSTVPPWACISSLLMSVIQCIRGARSSPHQPVHCAQPSSGRRQSSTDVWTSSKALWISLFMFVMAALRLYVVVYFRSAVLPLSSLLALFYVLSFIVFLFFASAQFSLKIFELT